MKQTQALMKRRTFLTFLAAAGASPLIVPAFPQSPTFEEIEKAHSDGLAISNDVWLIIDGKKMPIGMVTSVERNIERDFIIPTTMAPSIRGISNRYIEMILTINPSGSLFDKVEIVNSALCSMKEIGLIVHQHEFTFEISNGAIIEMADICVEQYPSIRIKYLPHSDMVMSSG